MENPVITDELQGQDAMESAFSDTENVAIEQDSVSGSVLHSETDWHYVDTEPSLLTAGFTLELRNVKTAMIVAPNHPIPIAVEGLLVEHHHMPLCAEMEIVLLADDREIVRERFFLPTPRRQEVMAAHRELAKMSSDFLTDSRLRDTAMTVYFPELFEEYDLWYKLSITENGYLNYSLHMGPSHTQDIKKRIEGSLQL